jgi:hypothetical protein
VRRWVAKRADNAASEVGVAAVGTAFRWRLEAAEAKGGRLFLSVKASSTSCAPSLWSPVFVRIFAETLLEASSLSDR